MSAQAPQRLALARVATALALLFLAGCGGPEPLTGTGRVLIRMTEWQQPWFEERVRAFAGQEQVELEVGSYQLIRDLPGELEKARARSELPVLVKVEERMIRPLAEAGLLRPLDAVVDGSQLEEDLAEYLPEALEPARFRGQTWGIPRKIEVMMLLYRRSAVRQAVSVAPSDREAFRTAVESAGLPYPEGRRLEGHPEEWDMVDLMEVAHVLGRIPLDGSIRPRFAHRTADTEGTVADFACLVYPLGFRAGTLTAMPGYAPFVKMERMAFARGLLPPLEGSGLHTPHLFEGWSEGRFHLSFFHQLDARVLLGHGPDSATVEDRQDMAFAPLPDGGPWKAEEGVSRVPFGGWWWCLPADGPGPDLGYRLARYLTSREVHAEECRRFGMMPIRKDLAEDLEETFPDPLLRSVMETAYVELDHRASKPDLDDESYRSWRQAVTR